MSFIAGQHNGRRILTDIYILNAKAYSNHKQTNVGVPFPAGPTFKALIDTGATSTLISAAVVAHLGGDGVTQNQYETAMGPVWLFAYLFYVAFKHTLQLSEETAEGTNNFRLMVAPPLICGGCVKGILGFDVLLGMDILATGQFLMDRHSFRFAF